MMSRLGVYIIDLFYTLNYILLTKLVLFLFLNFFTIINDDKYYLLKQPRKTYLVRGGVTIVMSFS